MGGPPVHLMWSTMFNPEKPRVNRAVDWRRVAGFFKPYLAQETAVLVCILVVALLGLLPPLVTKWLIDGPIAHKDLGGVALDVGLMVASALAAGFVGVYQGYLNSLVGEGIMRDIRTSLVDHLHRMPISFFTNTKTGEIMNRVSNDVDNIDNVVTGTLVSIVTNIATMVTTVVTMFLLNWVLALLALAVVPLMILPLSPVGRRMYQIRKKTREKRDEIESITQETLSISGIVLIKSFVREAFERKRFFAVGTDLMGLEIKLAMVGRWFMAAITAMVVIGPAIVWLGGGYLSIAHGLSVGTIVAFVALLGRLYGPASTLAGVQVQIVSALAVFERIFDYLDMAPEDKRAATRRPRSNCRTCPATSVSRTSTSPTRRSASPSTASRFTSRPARWPRSSGRPAPARRRSRSSSRASTIRRAASSASTGTTRATSTCTRCAPTSAS